jgi:prolipoprotein diacylglyceryltransferase
MAGTTPNSTVHAEPLRPGGLLGFLRDFHNKTILFRVGDWIFVTYGLLAGIAFFFGFTTTVWYMAMLGVDPAMMAAVCLFFVIPSILMVSRVTSILLEWRELFRRPLQTLLKPGYMLHGGIFGGILAMLGFSFASGMPFPSLLDAMGFAMPLGEALCRLGCFVYGCCWGKPTDSRFGVRYTSLHSKVIRFQPHLQGVKIHPTQIYALTAHLIQFTIFYALLPYKAFDGMFAALYLITHPMIRFVLERFRQDDRGKLGKLTHSNIYSFIMIGIGLMVLAFGLSSSGTNMPINVQYRFIHTIGSGTTLVYCVLTFFVAAAAFGLHYKAVGSWLSKPSGGVTAQVAELSMGAAARNDGIDDDGCDDCEHPHHH